jgi:hypothetical protein
MDLHGLRTATVSAAWETTAELIARGGAAFTRQE